MASNSNTYVPSFHTSLEMGYAFAGTTRRRYEDITATASDTTVDVSLPETCLELTGVSLDASLSTAGASSPAYTTTVTDKSQTPAGSYDSVHDSGTDDETITCGIQGCDGQGIRANSCPKCVRRRNEVGWTN